MAYARELFWLDAKAAVTIGGQWDKEFQGRSAHPDVMKNLGVAALPGTSFVGGSNLVVWEYTRHQRDAMQLVSFLVESDVQLVYPKALGLLPVKTKMFDDPVYSEEDVYRVAAKKMNEGRTFPTVSLWGVVERRMVTALGLIWTQILENPKKEKREIVEEMFALLAKRLQLTLKN